MFSKQTKAEIAAEFDKVPALCHQLTRDFAAHPFKSDRAREYATHGFGRRLKTLVRCVALAFKNVPPSRRKPPTMLARVDAEIAIQALVLNIAGCLDNLAWVWALERNVIRKNGKELTRGEIGLRAKHKTLRASMPQPLIDYLDSIDGWFQAHDDYRDSLAHRIPLYIPPYSVLFKHVDQHAALEREHDRAELIGDFDRARRLEREMHGMRFFQPLIVHSYSEGSPPIVFHAQLIADVKTIDEIARRMLAYFLPPPPKPRAIRLPTATRSSRMT